MVRIIPWKLPDVKGGSVGGYTPRNDGEGGDDELPAVFFDFTDAALSGSKGFTANDFTISSTPQEVTPTGLTYTGTITGIQAVDLTGVSSMQVKIKNVCVNYDVTIDTDATGGIILDVDILTYAISYSSGKVSASKTGGSATRSSGYLWTSDPTGKDGTMQFFVYNGNGEIIQQSEEISL
jgi:hypothetical protein